MRYAKEDTTIVFQEVPGEISISFSITGCPLRCPGCHSSYLQDEGYGEILLWHNIKEQLDKYRQFVTCVLFMGGDQYKDALLYLLKMIKQEGYTTCLYTGQDSVDEELVKFLDYYKVGPYIEALGGLSSKTTNQRFWSRASGSWLDATSDFQKGLL